MGNNERVAAELLDWFERNGDFTYDEAVTQNQHALQCAHIVREAGYNDATVVAALFHDIGHLVLRATDVDHDYDSQDLHHENVGSAFLSRYFTADVTEPVRLHVPAKRWLCSVDDDYYALLSPGSQRSLDLQGGVMSPEELSDLEQDTFLGLGVVVRQADDEAKNPNAIVPGFDAYRDAVTNCLLSNCAEFRLTAA